MLRHSPVLPVRGSRSLTAAPLVPGIPTLIRCTPPQLRVSRHGARCVCHSSNGVLLSQLLLVPPLTTHSNLHLSLDESLLTDWGTGTHNIIGGVCKRVCGAVLVHPNPKSKKNRTHTRSNAVPLQRHTRTLEHTCALALTHAN